MITRPVLLSQWCEELSVFQTFFQTLLTVRSMGDSDNLTDTELLGLISQTAGCLQKQQTRENLGQVDSDSRTQTSSIFVERSSESDNLVADHDKDPNTAITLKHPHVQADTNLPSSDLKSSESQSGDENILKSAAVSNTDLTVQVQTVTGTDLYNINSLTKQSSSLSPVYSLSQPVVKSEIKEDSPCTCNISQSALHCDVPSTSRSKCDTKSQLNISITSMGTQSPPQQLTGTSLEELITLAQEYRTELETTKKKLEKSERKLAKANDYNEVLRNMVNESINSN